MNAFLRGLFTQDFAFGVIASCVAAIIGWVVKSVVNKIRYYSPNNGTWEEIVYNEDRSIKRMYLLKIKHNPNTCKFKGKCTRIKPSGDKKYRTNKISGVISNNEFLYIVNANVPAQVRGAVHAVLEGNKFFKGYYSRYDLTKREIERIPIEITKCNDDPTPTDG